MKSLLVIVLAVGSAMAFGQGTFVFDQQSSDENNLREGAVSIGTASFVNPVQSFTPSLSSVGFVRLYFRGLDGYNMRINLRANSFDGPILGTTAPISTSGATYGPVDFFFPTAVSVTPQTVYYLEPTIQIGGGQVQGSMFYNYTGGMLYFSDGTSNPNYDMWFREGILVPEPTTVSLTLVAGSLLLWLKRKGAIQ